MCELCDVKGIMFYTTAASQKIVYRWNRVMPVRSHNTTKLNQIKSLLYCFLIFFFSF